MSATRDPSPQPIHTSITSYKQSTPQAQALRRRNIIVPPLYFGMVAPKIYRSGHPLQLNFHFLERLKLKTIIYLADQEYSAENIAWCELHGIRTCHIRMQSAKEPFIENDPALVAEALSHLLDSRNYPLLVHSNKGKHRCGVVVGCLRKLQGWSLASIFNEYDRYAQGKGESDLQFIETFNHTVNFDTQHKPSWMS